MKVSLLLLLFSPKPQFKAFKYNFALTPQMRGITASSRLRVQFLENSVEEETEIMHNFNSFYLYFCLGFVVFLFFQPIIYGFIIQCMS